MVVALKGTCLARPFLKWAGGKGQLIGDIEPRLPVDLPEGKIDKYVEPFVGGGAVFFYIAQKYASIKRFYLFDINQDLINCYIAVKENVELLIDELARIEEEFLRLNKVKQKQYYLKIRKSFNSVKDFDFGIQTTAKFIFLNKTCFNGLYRVNKKGLFNVPFGSYKRPTICAAENLRRASAVLQKAEIICGDFLSSKRFINLKTFVYFDPPYRPLNATASFTSYAKGSFSEEDQKRLAMYYKKLDTKGAKLMLSNSDPQNEDPEDNFFEKHYNGFKIDVVKATRAINCKATGRGQINELIIMNY